MLDEVVFSAEMPVTMRLGETYHYTGSPLMFITRVKMISKRGVYIWDSRNTPRASRKNGMLMKNEKVEVHVFFSVNYKDFTIKDTDTMLDIILYLCGRH